MILTLVFAHANGQIVNTKDREYKRSVKQKSKELTRKGYTAKGSGTVKIYVTEATNKEFAKDEEGKSINDVVYTSAVDPTFEGAISACRAAARAALAGNIQTNVGELVKRSLNTDQISAKSANGINSTVIAGKQLIAQKVSIDDIYILYREVKDERDGKTLIEVEYACYYDINQSLLKAQEFIREELKDETEELHKDLDKIFKLD
jgi:hypothetical protein